MKPETRDNLNLGLTVLGVILIPLLGALLNARLQTATSEITAHSDANVAALRQSITENFETKVDHSSDVIRIQESNRLLQQGQHELGEKVDKNNVEQRLSIQHLSDMILTGRNNKPNQ